MAALIPTIEAIETIETIPTTTNPIPAMPLVTRHSSLVLAALAFAAASAAAAPSVVRVEGAPGAQRLTVNGKPFVIKGAGGGGSKKVLAQLGANSFRTWAANDAEKQLDEAQKNGLYVTVGHWLHSTSYFSYTDEAKNAEQTEGILRRVRELKDHPALLMWAIGNEMEAANPNNRALWTYMNDLAGKIKEIDPNHPVTTALMEVWPEKIALVNELCPNLDIVGINTYAGCGGIGKRLREAGLKKPFIITEYGPPLHNDQNKWWIGVTDFGAPQELSSTQKAKWYVEPATDVVRPAAAGRHADGPGARAGARGVGGQGPQPRPGLRDDLRDLRAEARPGQAREPARRQDRRARGDLARDEGLDRDARRGRGGRGRGARE